MAFKFLLLFVIFALATALPRDRRSVESETDVSGEQQVLETTSTTTTSTTTAKPESKIITVNHPIVLDFRVGIAAADDVIILYLMTPWCYHSREVAPIIEKIAAEKKNVTVLKIDLDELSKNNYDGWKYDINKVFAMPTFVFIKNGIKVKQITGSRADISGTLDKIASDSLDSSDSSDSSDD